MDTSPADPVLLSRLDEGNRLLRSLSNSWNQMAMRLHSIARSTGKPNPLTAQQEQRTVDHLFAELAAFRQSFDLLAD